MDNRVFIDSAAALLDWAKAILLEIVKGIQNTFNYWNHRKDDLEDVFATTEATTAAN